MSEAPEQLSDLVQHRRDVDGEVTTHRFANGLTVKTEAFLKRDPLRILPLGGPQCSLMNHMLHFPDAVRGKRVFEPFAGSGGIGLMALKIGAAHLDLLDINPRAAEFHRENAALSGLDAARMSTITGDIATFVPSRRYDLILANPPFVPTPDGIEGTLTSNGGPEGNRFVEILLDRFALLLEPSGRALVYLLQITRGGEPTIVDVLARTITGRRIDLIPTQRTPVPFDACCTAYARLFADAEPAIERWRAATVAAHGADLALRHFILDIGPRRDGAASWSIRDDFAARFGEMFLVPSDDVEELALARVMENFVP
jgi:hypothetical protein